MSRITSYGQLLDRNISDPMGTSVAGATLVLLPNGQRVVMRKYPYMHFTVYKTKYMPALIVLSTTLHLLYSWAFQGGGVRGGGITNCMTLTPPPCLFNETHVEVQ